MRFLSLIAIMMLIVAGCSRSNQFRYEEGVAWNTLYHITYSSDKDLADSISTVFNLIDETLSPFNCNSEITAINENRRDSVSEMFMAVYNESRKIHEASGGIFDPTLAPLIRAWGFGQGHTVSADTLAIDSIMTFVGLDKTRLEGTRLVKEKPSTEFNFSALAKGYGVDCIADMLERNGVTDYLIEVGGEIRASGHNPRGKEWKIGVDLPSPDASDGEMITTVTLTDAALATSGNYRNYHENAAGRFGHTISPLTGRPVETDVVSATVVAPTCMEADALATCCMALGSRNALALCKQMNVGVILVLSDLSILRQGIPEE